MHKETTEQLHGTERVLARLAVLKEAVDSAIGAIESCVQESSVLLAKAAQYTTAFELILAAFKSLDASTAPAAKAFAAVLVEIIKLILPAEHLKELLKLSADALQATMEEVAAYKL